MLFHHSNGSCYVVDCGSAHGTFVNGKRIAPPANGGAVIPNKVRRGALIRFGGPGAPIFIMKSFSFRLKDIDATTESPDEGKLVRRNTRINALGKTAAEAVQTNTTDKFLQALDVCRKRSFDSVESNITLDEPSMKRVRCSSPPLSPEEPLRLVSPDMPTMTATRRVTFSNDPPQLFFPAMVTPEVLSSEEENDFI
jgi:pSer/pThr/pTyr-binding forkhead associated (FHA) protein